MMILGAAVATPIIFGLLVKECYGQSPEE